MTGTTGDTLPRREWMRAAATDAANDLIDAVPEFGPLPLVTLVWDDGTRHDLREATMIGRNPPPFPGGRALAVRDETLSLSRTHAAVGVTAGTVWIADAGSMNGTVIVRGDVDYHVIPGEHWVLRAGDIIEFGDRRALIEGV